MEFAMPFSSIVIEHHFDPDMLSQIETLRSIRLNMAENLMRDLERTEGELKTRGLVDATAPMDRGELKKELGNRIKVMRSRIERPDVIYADEISLYADLLEHDQSLEGAVEAR